MAKSKVEELLANATGKKEKIKSSFNLDKGLFEGFKKLCDGKNLSQSEVIEAMLEDLMNKVGQAAIK